MDPKIWWVITTVLTLMIGVIGYLYKRSVSLAERRETEIKRDIEELDRSIKELDAKLNQTIKEMPYLYTLREDHIRIMASVERRLDKITDLLQGGKQ